MASVLPVWLLLQPRDYLNSHQLVTGLFLLTAGLLVLQPVVQAPALNLRPEGAPPLIPFLFITIACGAISGFHGLVSSGTTSKQIGCMTDARAIGYGGMLGEGILGLLAVLASTAGFASAGEWQFHYGSWGAAEGLSSKLGAFVNGGGRIIEALGVPFESGTTFIAVMVIAFAATSLETGARILRLVISELGSAYAVRPLENRYTAGLVGVGLAMVLAVTQAGGKGGLITQAAVRDDESASRRGDPSRGLHLAAQVGAPLPLYVDPDASGHRSHGCRHGGRGTWLFCHG